MFIVYATNFLLVCAFIKMHLNVGFLLFFLKVGCRVVGIFKLKRFKILFACLSTKLALYAKYYIYLNYLVEKIVCYLLVKNYTNGLSVEDIVPLFVKSHCH